MKQKRCVELYIPHYNPQTHYTTGVWSHIELASLYTVPLSAVNDLSRLTKLTTNTGAGTADSIQKIFEWANHFWIKSNRTADSNSNLEASQVPTFSILTIRGLQLFEEDLRTLAGSGFGQSLFWGHRTISLMKLTASTMLPAAIKRQCSSVHDGTLKHWRNLGWISFPTPPMINTELLAEIKPLSTGLN